MALSHKAKKRWSLVILLIGMPIYMIVVMNIFASFWEEPNRPPILLELLAYVVAGFAWILPFRKVFLGVGQADPEAEQDGR